MHRNHRFASTLLVTALFAGCGDDPLAAGQFEASVYGEEFIEEGIPADVFADGWSVTFDRFLVSVGGVRAQAGHDAGEQMSDAYTIVDLAEATGGDGHVIATLDVPGGAYDHFGYALVHDADSTALNVDAADADAMRAAGYALWVQGSATDGTDTFTFDWGFTFGLVITHCEIAVTIDGGSGGAQATIHADHLFYDDAVSAEPDVAFQAIADADGADGTEPDGDITPAELAAVDITTFERYQVGSLDIDDLWGFVSHQVSTVGHVDGEGHCEDVTVLD